MVIKNTTVCQTMLNSFCTEAVSKTVFKKNNEFNLHVGIHASVLTKRVKK